MSGERYSDTVNYDFLDPVKQLSMELFAPTLKHTERFGIKIDPRSIGEPATVIRLVNKSRIDNLGLNIEGLGTKNLIAENMYEVKEKIAIAEATNQAPLFRNLGIDTVAMSALDQLSVYSDIFFYGIYMASGSSKYFVAKDGKLNEKTKQLLTGFRQAADDVSFAIGCGETPTLSGVIYENTLDLAGFSVGVVHKNAQPIGGLNINEGDRIVFLPSNDLHANGISKVRRLSSKLKDGWSTPVPEGNSNLGEAVLKPTHVYVRPVIEMIDKEIPIHYMGPITGHGWKKIMRPRREFKYVIEQVPELSPLFRFLVSEGLKNGFDVSPQENYSVWNMGAGWFMMVDRQYVEEMRKISKRHNLELFDYGHVERGSRSVVLPVEHDGKKVIYTAGG